jgi:hypothetical protein
VNIAAALEWNLQIFPPMNPCWTFRNFCVSIYSFLPQKVHELLFCYIFTACYWSSHIGEVFANGDGTDSWCRSRTRVPFDVNGKYLHPPCHESCLTLLYRNVTPRYVLKENADCIPSNWQGSKSFICEYA